MKRVCFVALCLLFVKVTITFAQQSVSVLESTFKLASFETRDFYYAFAQGDKLLFSFQEMGGKELNYLRR